jgi:hypothetical protein
MVALKSTLISFTSVAEWSMTGWPVWNSRLMSTFVLIEMDDFQQIYGVSLPTHRLALVRRSSDIWLEFLQLLSLRSFVYLPSSSVIPPPQMAYDATLPKRRAECWADTCQSRSIKKEHTHTHTHTNTHLCITGINVWNSYKQDFMVHSMQFISLKITQILL